MSKLERIHAFISVVEQNGFAAAARKEGISTAAISRQVTRLETELNVELLHRTTRHISLTEIGAEYYRHSKKALADLVDAEIAISNSQTEPRGLLNVTSNRFFAIKYLLPRLPEFMALYPKLQVKIELAERFPDLTEENVDLIFGVSMDGPSSLVRRQVSATRYILCASPDYLERYGTPHLPTELSGHLYITHSMRQPDNVVPLNDNKLIYVKPSLWLNDSQTMCECAIKGMGIVRLHDYIVADAIADGRLIEILPEYSVGKQAIYLYYQPSRYLQPKIRRFIDFYTSNN